MNYKSHILSCIPVEETASFDVTVQCPYCHNEYHVMLDIGQYIKFKKWMYGEGKIQNLLPDITDDDRELLISGLCPTDFKHIFEEVI